MIWYTTPMSYKTVEVELKNGCVSTIAPEVLPEKAHALLTILDLGRSTPPPARDRSLADLVGDMAGIGRGEHADLSTNRSHLDNFGR